MIPAKGNRLIPSSAGSAQVASFPAPKKGQAPIQVRRFARNRKHPDADLEIAKNEHLNQIAIYRTKQVFNGMANLLGGNSTTTHYPNGDRWRFAFHSGPLATALFVRFAQGIPSSTGTNAYAQVDLYSDATETTLVSSTIFAYGADPTNGSHTGGWQFIRVIDQFIEIQPDTDYYVKVSNQNGSTFAGASFVELASMTENAAGAGLGYLTQNVHAQGNILDVYRENQAKLIKSLWKRGGAHVLNWTTDPGDWPTVGTTGVPNTYKTTTSATPTNIIDLASVTVSASTPGWTVDMTGKARLSQTTGVPCVMKAFGKVPAGGANGGRVYLKDSGGAIIASIINSWNGTTGAAQWLSASFNLPASSAKYDIQYDKGLAAEFDLWAVSIYEYEA